MKTVLKKQHYIKISEIIEKFNLKGKFDVSVFEGQTIYDKDRTIIVVMQKEDKQIGGDKK